jgi:hypothetical protein
MSDSSKKHSVMFRVIVTLAILLAYPMSFGPACWLSQRTGTGHDYVWIAYRPFWWTMKNGSEPLRESLFQYATSGAEHGKMLAVGDLDYRWIDRFRPYRPPEAR